VDHDRVGLPDHGNFAWRALGLRGVGLGRLLGLGPSGECFAPAGLTGTAFLHSVMMQEKRGMMKVWNVWLVFVTFMLCILGTLLTRSGVVSSVPAFAQSSIGNWFVGFLCNRLGGLPGSLFQKQRLSEKTENQLDRWSPVSPAFYSIISFVGCVCGGCFPGYTFPRRFRSGSPDRASVLGAPFFNKVNIPLGLIAGCS